MGWAPASEYTSRLEACRLQVVTSILLALLTDKPELVVQVHPAAGEGDLPVDPEYANLGKECLGTLLAGVFPPVQARGR